jgi:hypothetical protein
MTAAILMTFSLRICLAASLYPLSLAIPNHPALVIFYSILAFGFSIYIVNHYCCPATH